MNIRHVLAQKGGQVYTVGPDQTVREALALLAAHNVGALVVVDREGRPVGIISERDIVRAAVADEQLFGRPVRQLMTRELIVASPEDDLRVVAHTMTERRIRHLPVVMGDRLVGIVSIGDLVKAQRDAYEGEIDILEARVTPEHP
ncbi:MAG: CBS domain-containing protein [Armatimonadota bacterium]|nr:CBS domain-containing protein [Armatimonadota bacterium]MDR7452721.1 CBS domain-containing protein [Armatimonadota bacterium]MDR7467630.1 CBS domain-containing protein [Armatimonadota bacterium]MDR7494409.1 CBS domain-containing protein [Armatimonadota bacterium]MDR7500446.1 CBS domain-containing protein [Armatimonadota bacterium]